MLPSYLKDSPQGVLILLHIQPQAKKNEVIGLHGDRLKVKIKAPPVDGAANAEVIQFLSDLLHVRQNQLRLESGETSRQKSIRVLTAMTSAQVHAHFFPA